MDGKWRSEHRSELFRIAGQHHLTTVLHHQLRLEYPGDRDQRLRLGGLTGLVDEDVREVIGREVGRHEAAGRHQSGDNHAVVGKLRSTRENELTVSVVAVFLHTTRARTSKLRTWPYSLTRTGTSSRTLRSAIKYGIPLPFFYTIMSNRQAHRPRNMAIYLFRECCSRCRFQP